MTVIKPLGAAAFVASLFLVFNLSCSSSIDPSGSAGGCARDANCPPGEECTGAGCVPVRPTLYPNIQLGSVLLREYLDDTEIQFRAAHNDVIIATAVLWADQLRAVNPNLRIFEYFTNKFYIHPTIGEPWARANGYDPEDFYLHYKEDVYFPQFANIVLVSGHPLGTVPGWNPNRSPSDPPASASERRESRALWDGGGIQPWYLGNIAHAGYRRFLIHFARGLLDGSTWGATVTSGPLDGVAVDNAIYYPEFNEGFIDKTAEFYGIALDSNHPYAVAYETFYPELYRELALYPGRGTDVLPNYSHTFFLSYNHRFPQNIQKTLDWAWAEVWVMYWGRSSPTTGSARVITYDADYRTGVANIVRQTRSGGRRTLGARDVAGDINGTDRGRTFTLALYYLIHNANTFYFYTSLNSHYANQHLSLWQWNPLVEIDIGAPDRVPAGWVDFEGLAGTKEHYVLASGPDPVNPLLTYRVLARKFTKGMVLAKMLPAGSVVDDRSITVHSLDQPYVLVNPDGTLGPVVTQVSIRNNEGILLVTP